MKKLIFTTFLLLGAAGVMTAIVPQPTKSEAIQRTVETGRLIKKTADTPVANKVLNPDLRKGRRVGSLPDGFILYEDFEAWDGTSADWLPEGWTIDHRNSPESDRGWKITAPMGMYDVIDSKCMTYELFNDVDVDEWLITPEFTVKQGMELTWGTMTSPYFYNWDYFDSATYQLTQYEIVNDIKVNITTDDGATWTTIFSHAEDLIETSASFFDMFDYTVRPFSLDLGKYAGETVKIGFQITGRDGNTSFIDDVSVGLPLTETSYLRPMWGLFMGLSDTDEYVPASIMVGPVFEPVKFTNNTPTYDATFTWTYDDTYGKGNISTDKDLTVTYGTDHTSAATSRNNMYGFPVLEGVSPSTAEDVFTYPGFFQAGGKGEYERYFIDTEDYEIVNLGLTSIDAHTEGTATWADIAVPYFGYNRESDMFWGRYTFGNDYVESPDDWSHLEKIAQFFYTPEAPLVINGVHHNAYGKVSRNTVFKVEIFPLSMGFVIADEPIASAVCTGNDIKIVDRYSSSDFLSLNFKFDSPVIIDRKKNPYFVVAISGFRDAENVEYFSPEMSNFSNPYMLGFGWIGLNMSYMGDELPLSWGSVTGVTGDDNRVSFYIMLDAEYPWLHREDEPVTIKSDSSVTVGIDSYYEGKEFTFEGLPSWLSATARGRYDKTEITFTADKVPADGDVTVTVKVPGASCDITLSALAESGVDTIAGAEDGAYAVYDLSGRKVVGNLTPGIYIRRYSDGRAVKFVHK